MSGTQLGTVSYGVFLWRDTASPLIDLAPIKHGRGTLRPWLAWLGPEPEEVQRAGA